MKELVFEEPIALFNVTLTINSENINIYKEMFKNYDIKISQWIDGATRIIAKKIPISIVKNLLEDNNLIRMIITKE